MLERLRDKAYHGFAGDDSREHIPFKVCAHSLARRSTYPVEVTPIYHKTLRHAGMFYRPWKIDEDGQYWDEVDGKPFSTEFSHSRFLVPEIARRNNLSGWVLFCDCDYPFLSDVCEVFDYCDNDYAVMCVKHNYHPEEAIKMDGMLQQDYNKKLWSSFVLYNLDHPANDRLDEVMVNSETGANLHNFCWLDSDDQIGSLPHGWNFIPGVSHGINDVKAVHYSLGGPWLDGYQDSSYAEEWEEELDHFEFSLSSFRKIVEIF